MYRKILLGKIICLLLPFLPISTCIFAEEIENKESAFRLEEKEAVPKDRFTLYLEKGLESASDGKWEEAKDSLKEALKENKFNFDGRQLLNIIAYAESGKLPEEAALHYFKGIRYLQPGQHKFAIAELKKAIAIKPDFKEAFTSIGIAYYYLGDYSKMRDYAQQALSIDSNFEEAYYDLGLYYYTLKQYDKAIANLKKAVRISPKYSNAYLCLGYACTALNRTREAIVYYQKAVKIEPGLGSAYFALASAYTDLAETDKAKSYLRKAAELFRSQGQNQLAQEAEEFDYYYLDQNILKNAGFYYNRGIWNSRKRKSDEAMEDFNKAIELEPGYADAYFERGKIYFSRGTSKWLENQSLNVSSAENGHALSDNIMREAKKYFELAIADDNRAIELKPDVAEYYFYRALNYDYMDDLEQGILDYSKSIELNPNYRDAYVRRSYDYFRKRDYSKSWQDVSKAQELGAQVSADFLNNLKKHLE